jgi:hypothetical protein
MGGGKFVRLIFLSYLSRGHFGLWVDAEFYHGTSAPCLTFNNEKLSAAEQFEVIFLECWGFD